MPRISVLLPVYNAEKFLPEAIESVLGQSYDDFELIAIDDGSNDNSLEILERYSETDNRIRIISRENRGLTPTLNEGIELAIGEYIARMDADDICIPERFAVQLAFLDAHPEICAVGGQVILIDEEGRELTPFSLPHNHADIDKSHLSGPGSEICHPAAMIRTKVLEHLGGYNEANETAQDFDLWLRMAEVGQLANVDQIVLYYRQHLQSVGYAKRNKQRLTAWRAIKAAAQRRGIRIDFDAEVELNETPATILNIYARWAWWALGAGNVATARYYAWKRMRGAPFSLDSWRLMVCSLRGW